MHTVVDEPVRLELLAAEPQAARPLVAQQAQPMTTQQPSVVEYAMRNGASAAEVTALVQLQIQMDNHKREMRKLDDEREREQRAESARVAYFEAMAAFKAEAIKVIRSKEITDGPLRGKKHADLKAVYDAATEAMSKHGLSTSWRTLADDKDWIKIACVVKHVAGYSEEVAFGGPIDTGPGRNAIQARKSTVTYLERITMLLALGLAEGDADDDGAGGGNNDGGDISDLLSELVNTATDKAAHAFWIAKREGLKADRGAYERFKQAVVQHRRVLAGEAK